MKDLCVKSTYLSTFSLQIELESEQASEIRRDIHFVCELLSIARQRHVGVERGNGTRGVGACGCIVYVGLRGDER